jgi:hypothetical protein
MLYSIKIKIRGVFNKYNEKIKSIPELIFSGYKKGMLIKSAIN